MKTTHHDGTTDVIRAGIDFESRLEHFHSSYALRRRTDVGLKVVGFSATEVMARAFSDDLDHRIPRTTEGRRSTFMRKTPQQAAAVPSVGKPACRIWDWGKSRASH